MLLQPLKVSPLKALILAILICNLKDELIAFQLVTMHEIDIS